MTAEQDTAKPDAETSTATNPIQLSEQLADSLWRLTEAWNDYAKTTIAVPLLRAMDEIGLQLRFTLGQLPLKQHLQHFENARRALIPVEYYLQQAHRRGLMESDRLESFRKELINLAQRLDQHRQAIVQAANKLAEQKKQQEQKAKKVAQAENNPMVTKGGNVAH